LKELNNVSPLDSKSSLEDRIFCLSRKNKFTFSELEQQILVIGVIMYLKKGEINLDQDNFIDVSLITFIILSTSFITITSLS